MRDKQGGERPDLARRLEAVARRRPLRVGGRNLSLVAVRVWRRFVDVRVTGLAAEMTYYALLSVVPLVVAFGAGLGLLERFLADEDVVQIEDAVIDALDTVFQPDVTEEVIAPLVRGLLREERTQLAASGVLVSLWLASRVFRAAIRALDDAYAVEERRRLPMQWFLAGAFALGAVVVSILALSFFVVGPLLGGGTQLAEWLGLGGAFEVAWDVGRWPLVGLTGVAFLAFLYDKGPNARTTVRGSLPGAALAVVAIALIGVGFRLYLRLGGPELPGDVAPGEAVDIALAMLSAVLAGVLWAWLTSIAVLTGGVLNAELAKARAEDAADAEAEAAAALAAEEAAEAEEPEEADEPAADAGPGTDPPDNSPATLHRIDVESTQGGGEST